MARGSAAARRHRKEQLELVRAKRRGEREAKASRMESHLAESAADAPLISRAVAGGWPVTDKVRSVVLRKMMKHVRGDDSEDSIAAARVVVKMDEINLKAQQGSNGKGGPVNVSVSVGVAVGQQVQSAVAAEPEYLEWLRERELAEGGHANAVGTNGHGGQVPHALAYPQVGPGRNGHHPGN